MRASFYLSSAALSTYNKNLYAKVVYHDDEAPYQYCLLDADLLFGYNDDVCPFPEFRVTTHCVTAVSQQYQHRERFILNAPASIKFLDLHPKVFLPYLHSIIDTSRTSPMHAIWNSALNIF